MSGKQKLTKLLKDVYGTKDDEAQCNDIEPLIILSAGDGLTDQESKERYSLMWRHFQFCSDCYQEYRLLADLMKAQAIGELERPTKVPLAPLLDMPVRDPKDDIGKMIQTTFSGFIQAITGETVARSRNEAETNFEAVRVEMGNGLFNLDLTIQAENEHPDRRKLIVEMSTDNVDLKANLSGTPIWLQAQNSDQIIQESSFDEIGSTSFENIPTDVYRLFLRIGDDVYTLLDLELP